MSTWKDRASKPDTGASSDWKTRAVDAAKSNIAPEEPLHEDPGALESAARGVEQGVTLGFGDEVNGGLEALLKKMTGGDNGMDLIDAYRKHRDESRANMEAAEKAHPYISGAANLAGSIAPALLTGGGSLAEQGLAGAAKMGAKYGAVSALGNSSADLTKGEVGQAAADTALGGAVGGALAPATQLIGKELQGPVGSLMDRLKGAGSALADIGPVQNTLDAFKQGAISNRRVIGKQANKALNQELIDSTAGIGSDIQSSLDTLSKSKMDRLTSDEPGVNIGDWYKSALTGMKNLKSKFGQNEAVADDLSKIQSLLERHVFGSEEDGIPGKGLNFSAEDAENLLRQLGALGSQGDASLKTSAASELVNRLVSPLSREPNLIDRAIGLPEGYTSLGEMVAASRPAGVDAAGNAIPGLSELNAKSHSLLTAKDQLPAINDIANLEKTSLGGVNSSDRIQKFLETLPPDMAEKYSAQMKDLANAKSVADKISAPGLSHGIIADSIRGTTYGGANVLGLVGRALYDMTPEGVKSFAGAVTSQGGEVAQKLGSILNQAADRDKIGRNALFFAVQQNPEYREILRKASGEPTPQK